MRLDTIEVGDAKILTGAIPEASVDLILCDPVYWNTEDYAWLGGLAARVLRDGGALLAQVGEPFWFAAERALRSGAADGLIHLTPIVEVYHFATSGYRTGDTNFSSGYTPWIFATKGPKKCSVMNRVYGKRDKEHHKWGDGLHFARTYIEVLTRPGDVVLDPFVGGGTVPAACVMRGRHFYGCEIDPVTAERSRSRLATVAYTPTLTEGAEQFALGLAEERHKRRKVKTR